MTSARWLLSGSPGLVSLRFMQLKDPVPLFGYTRCDGGKRRWLLCPGCHKRVGKLYRPLNEVVFACRQCHDARLDRLLKVPLEVLQQTIASPKHHIALLGIKATYIRFGLIDKY